MSLQHCHTEGNSNFVLLKCMLQNLLEEVELAYLVEREVVFPTDPKQLAEQNRKLVKAEKISDRERDYNLEMLFFLKNLNI